MKIREQYIEVIPTGSEMTTDTIDVGDPPETERLPEQYHLQSIFQQTGDQTSGDTTDCEKTDLCNSRGSDVRDSVRGSFSVRIIKSVSCVFDF